MQVHLPKSKQCLCPLGWQGRAQAEFKANQIVPAPLPNCQLAMVRHEEHNRDCAYGVSNGSHQCIQSPYHAADDPDLHALHLSEDPMIAFVAVARALEKVVLLRIAMPVCVPEGSHDANDASCLK
eukprot:364922-Chlamydomonas_euryale.AAC.8